LRLKLRSNQCINPDIFSEGSQTCHFTYQPIVMDVMHVCVWH